MNKKQFSKLCMLILFNFLLLAGNYIEAQTLRLNPKTSTITISGTTNVHDWKSNVTQMKGDLTVNNSKKIQSMSVDIPVVSIKSEEKEKLMDKKTYEAFNSEKNPTISFHLTEVNDMKINGTDINVTVTGNLTMGGTTKKIVLKSIGKNTKTGVYEFKGNVALKMTDFKMKPPTALLGIMKVGDTVTLNYDMNFEGSQID
ncbi:MAG: YceI family protein [Paludibacter sp.]|nr:YceI family protein [Paludibacter sp.]